MPGLKPAVLRMAKLRMLSPPASALLPSKVDPQTVAMTAPLAAWSALLARKILLGLP